MVPATGENAGFEEHPVLFVTAAVIMLIVLWQLLWPRERGADIGGRLSPPRVGAVQAAKLAIAAISLLAAASARVLLSIAAGACVVVLIAWEAWWWRSRDSRRGRRRR